MEKTHFIDKEPNTYEALAELHKEQIQSMNQEHIVKLIDTIEFRWDLKSDDFRNARELGYRQYIHPDNYDTCGNPDPSNIDIMAIKGIRERNRRFMVDLKNHTRELKIHNFSVDEDGITLVKRINNVLKTLHVVRTDCKPYTHAPGYIVLRSIYNG